MADDLRRVLISGDVQGVNFRNWTVEKARGVGLRGWVRNIADGTVEAVFSGDLAKVEAIIELCRRGPPRAKVKKLTELPATFDMLSLIPAGQSFAKIADARRPAG